MGIFAGSCWRLCSRVFMGSTIADFLGSTHSVVRFLKYLVTWSEIHRSVLHLVLYMVPGCRGFIWEPEQREDSSYFAISALSVLLKPFSILFIYLFKIETSCEGLGRRKALGRPTYLTAPLVSTQQANWLPIPCLTAKLLQCVLVYSLSVLKFETMSSCIWSETTQPLLFFHPIQLQVSCMVHVLCIYQTTTI